MVALPSPAQDLSERLSGRVLDVCRTYLSNGRRSGRYWTVGDVQNSRGRSMFVRLSGPASGRGAAGHWIDMATGEHGDLVDLLRMNRGLPSLGTRSMRRGGSSACRDRNRFVRAGATQFQPRGPAPVRDRPAGARHPGRALPAIPPHHGFARLRSLAVPPSRLVPGAWAEGRLCRLCWQAITDHLGPRHGRAAHLARSGSGREGPTGGAPALVGRAARARRPVRPRDTDVVPRRGGRRGPCCRSEAPCPACRQSPGSRQPPRRPPPAEAAEAALHRARPRSRRRGGGGATASGGRATGLRGGRPRAEGRRLQRGPAPVGARRPAPTPDAAFLA